MSCDNIPEINAYCYHIRALYRRFFSSLFLPYTIALSSTDGRDIVILFYLRFRRLSSLSLSLFRARKLLLFVDTLLQKKAMYNSTATDLQKPNIYNQYLPFYDSIQQQSHDSLKEICENLSRLIQLQELQPGFPLWSSKLQQFISLYGFAFTKTDHLKLIHFYLSLLSIKNFSFVNAKICFDILAQLTRFV